MNRFKLAVVCALAMAVSQASFAAPNSGASKGYNLEVAGGSRANFTFGSFSPVTWSYGLDAKAGYLVTHGIQAVLGLGFTHAYSGVWSLTLNALAGVRLNHSFSDDIKNDFFLFLGARVNNIPGFTNTLGVITNNTVTATFEAEIGKRFAITDSVTYAPALTFSAGSGVAMSAVPVQFTVLF